MARDVAQAFSLWPGRMPRSALCLLAIVLGEGMASLRPAHAGEPPVATQAAPEAPTFLIERISVEGGGRSSAKIVARETLLTPGASYTEAQLREGLQRVQRLPFVVEADFSLRKGTERGRFELVISVSEAKLVFVGASLGGTYRSGACCGFDGWGGEVDGPGLGARLFFGGHGELSAGLAGFGYSRSEGTFARYNVAYTHHDLFGTHVAGTVAFGPQRRGTVLRVQLAVPSSRRSAFQLAGERLTRRLIPFLGTTPSTSLESLRASLLWQRDTTDDPFTPRRGSRFGAALAYVASRYDGTSLLAPGADKQAWVQVPAKGEEGAVLASVEASRHAAISPSLSVGIRASLDGFVTRGDDTVVLDGASRQIQPDSSGLAGTIGLRLIGTVGQRRPGRTQFWWTAGAAFSERARWRTCDQPLGCDALPSLSEQAFGTPEDDDESRPGLRGGHSRYGNLSASIAARGRWGTATLTFSYRHFFLDR